MALAIPVSVHVIQNPLAASVRLIDAAGIVVAIVTSTEVARQFGVEPHGLTGDEIVRRVTAKYVEAIAERNQLRGELRALREQPAVTEQPEDLDSLRPNTFWKPRDESDVFVLISINTVSASGFVEFIVLEPRSEVMNLMAPGEFLKRFQITNLERPRTGVVPAWNNLTRPGTSTVRVGFGDNER